MASVECILCGDTGSSKHYASVENYEYLECTNCGLIYVKDIAPTNILYHSYDGGILKSFRRKLFAPVRRMRNYKNYDQSLARGKEIVGTAAKFLGDRFGTVSFLDIGANRGFVLAAGLERGWNVHGIEIVPELLIPFGNTHPQLRGNLYGGRFADLESRFPDQSFDLVTAIDVIEHFEDPVLDIKNIYRILKPGGVFVLQTPDTSCVRARAEAGNWGALKPLEHLYLFNPENLKKLTARIGFREYRQIEVFEEADGNFAAILVK